MQFNHVYRFSCQHGGHQGSEQRINHCFFDETAALPGEGKGWLNWAGMANVALDGDGCPKDFKEMNTALVVKNSALFGEDFKPGHDEIHMLVVAIIQVEPNLVEQIAWTAPEACPRLVVDKKDPLIRLPWVCIDGAGTGRNVGKDLLLYRRAPLRKQWHEIDRCAIRTHARLWVVGPPDTEESCAALAFAHTLNPSIWNVVWIHYTRSEYCFNCVRLMGGKKTTCVVPLNQLARLDEVLESTTIVFLDAFIEPPHEGAAARSMCNWWRKSDENHRRVVFVCSMGASDNIFRVEDARPIISAGNDFDNDDEAAFQVKESAESKPAGNDDQDMKSV